jgi:hypothetical protein
MAKRKVTGLALPVTNQVGYGVKVPSYQRYSAAACDTPPGAKNDRYVHF